MVCGPLGAEDTILKKTTGFLPSWSLQSSGERQALKRIKMTGHLEREQ